MHPWCAAMLVALPVMYEAGMTRHDRSGRAGSVAMDK
jgi:hypothetical protein